MKDFIKYINTPNHGVTHVVSYRGEHYVLDGKRTTKKRILRRFSMSEDDLRAEGDFQMKREKPRPVRWVF